MSSSPGVERRSVPRLEGRRLGRYQILGYLASGGMATVHVARAEGTFGFERLVAVKVLHPHLASEDELATMFVDEARMAARIRHPKVVSVLDVADDPNEGLYLVMDYVEGDHLGALLQGLRASRERMPSRVAARIVLDLLEGLDAAHALTNERGEPTPIIHRDVTPHNLLVGTDGTTRLSDFGIARTEARFSQTRDGQFKGKVSYMAPEQIREGVASARTDLFSAGIVLFECLTMTRLFRGDTTADTLRKLLFDPIPLVDELVPEALPYREVVARALAREPEARFASAAEMAEALETAAMHASGIAQPREVGELVRRYRSDALTERAQRFRAAAEQLTQVTDVTVTSRGRVVERTRTTPVPPPDAPPAPRRPRAVLGAAIVGIAALAALSVAYGTHVVSRDRHAGAVAATPDARPEDAQATLERGITPIAPSSELSLSPMVITRLRVGADGRVLDARIVNPRPDLEAFERVALAAVRGYVFRPARRGGVAVASTIDHPVRFSRENDAAHVVRIKGSDTIGGALAPALADAFRTVRPDIRVEIEALGSSTAFVGLFDGSAELGASSRPIKASELAEARRLGIVLEETIIGYDGIAILVHRDNPLREVTLDTLAALFAGRVADFADVGGPRGRPTLVGRPSYSGTHAFFESHVLEPRSLAFAEDVVALEHSDAIVRRVAADPLAIAYVGAAYVDASVRAVPVVRAGTTTAVLPNEATIRDGTYPIYRPLLLYTRGAPTGAAAELVRFVLSPSGRAIVRAHGFVASEAGAASAPSPTESGAGSSRTLDRVAFSMGQMRVPEEATRTLARIADAVRARPDARIVLVGHADREGSEADNVRIGRARAAAVADWLARAGIDRARMTIESRGSSAPVATNDTDDGRRENRRVDVLVID